MEKWSEKGHSTRAVQATPAQAFRQPFSACSRRNTGADSRSLRLLQPLVPGASDRPHDRCAPPSCRLRHQCRNRPQLQTYHAHHENVVARL